MANNVIADPGAGGATFKTTDNAGVHTPHSNIDNTVTVTGTVTTGGLTDTELRATPVPVSGTVTASGPLTDAQLRATPVPVSGTVTANAGTNLNTSALALESGGNLAAQTTALQIIDDWDETDRAKVNPIVGQAGVQGGSGAVSANTQRVSIATDNTVVVTGAIALNADNVVDPNALYAGAFNYVFDGTNWDRARGDTTNGLDVDVTRLPALVAGSANIGDVDVVTVPNDPFGLNADAASATGSISAKLKSIASTTVQMVIDSNSNLKVQTQRPSSATTTQVADSASSVQLLASTASRQGATITNDSTVTLYVKLGTTASLTDYTVPLVAGAYYEVPFGYTGRIDGIWASDPGTGAARITELAP